MTPHDGGVQRTRGATPTAPIESGTMPYTGCSTGAANVICHSRNWLSKLTPLSYLRLGIGNLMGSDTGAEETKDETRQDEAAKMDVKVWYLQAATSNPTR